MEPLFSVVVCTYNRARLLLRALRSLLHQTWRDWEAIIVDDGSTDATPLLLAAAAAEEPRLRPFRTAHRGAGAARWYGIRRARGTFITFLDSDDEYHPEHLELRARYVLACPDVDFLHGGVEIIGPPLVPDRHNPGRWIPVSECVVGGTFVVRRTLVLQLGYPRCTFADDARFFERLHAAGIEPVVVPFPTYRYYRTTPDSLCTRIGRLSAQDRPFDGTAA